MKLLQTAKHWLSPPEKVQGEARTPASPPAFADPAIEEADLKAEALRHWDEKRMTGEDDSERYQQL